MLFKMRNMEFNQTSGFYLYKMFLVTICVALIYTLLHISIFTKFPNDRISIWYVGKPSVWLQSYECCCTVNWC